MLAERIKGWKPVFVRPPAPLIAPLTVIAPLVALKVRVPLRARSRLIVCALVEKFVTLPPKVMRLPQSANAPAPLLKVSPANDGSVSGRSLVFTSLCVPLKESASSALGAVASPSQLFTVLHFASLPPPSHVRSAAQRTVVTDASIRLTHMRFIFIFTFYQPVSVARASRP